MAQRPYDGQSDWVVSLLPYARTRSLHATPTRPGSQSAGIGHAGFVLCERMVP
jgi:hypothetical protein